MYFFLIEHLREKKKKKKVLGLITFLVEINVLFI